MNNYSTFVPQISPNNQLIIQNQLDMIIQEINRLEERIINIERSIHNQKFNKINPTPVDSDNYTYINNNYSTDNYIL